MIHIEFDGSPQGAAAEKFTVGGQFFCGIAADGKLQIEFGGKLAVKFFWSEATQTWAREGDRVGYRWFTITRSWQEGIPRGTTSEKGEGKGA